MEKSLILFGILASLWACQPAERVEVATEKNQSYHLLGGESLAGNPQKNESISSFPRP
ncbi:hypothetical protein [Algoriphagus boritolerans]|uniref:hypothetical protein n=1 Tax=Algoriphagus boritolerans TaxID=308111 RepID=UPI000A429A4D